MLGKIPEEQVGVRGHEVEESEAVETDRQASTKHLGRKPLQTASLVPSTLQYTTLLWGKPCL